MPPHASLFARLTAAIIDAIPVVPVAIFLEALRGSGDILFDGSSGVGASSREINLAYWDLFWALVWVHIVYSAALEILTKGTFGKRVLGIRSLDSAGPPLTGGRALMRNIAKIVSIYIFFVGILWALIDRRNRTWHDLMVGTYVGNLRGVAES